MVDVIETRNIFWPQSSGAKKRKRCVAGCWVQFHKDVNYELANYCHSYTALLKVGNFFSSS
jgi:hypothetical protein